MDKLYEFIDISKKDSKAELECKLLSNEIKTKDTADKLMKSIQLVIIETLVGFIFTLR